jgi:IS4 transposase
MAFKALVERTAELLDEQQAAEKLDVTPGTLSVWRSTGRYSKHDWCVFLTTDTHLDAQKMLQIYSMRWAIEVYFKESKQHLGFLQEQARHYAC